MVNHLFWDIKVTSEEEEKTIQDVAKRIHDVKMDSMAILFLETVKPLSFIGMELGRFMLSPWLLVFNESIGVKSEKLLQIFEKRENVEKLLVYLENFSREEEKEKKLKKQEKQTEKPEEKKSWRRFLPF